MVDLPAPDDPTSATICPGCTLANAGRVPSVTASSTRLSRSVRARSTDDTLAVARRYESNVVRVLSQRNTGAAAARNTASR